MAYGKLYGGTVTQHEGYAVTGRANQDETFGVEGHDHTHKPNRKPKIGRKRHLRDHERGVGPSINHHPRAQAVGRGVAAGLMAIDKASHELGGTKPAYCSEI